MTSFSPDVRARLASEIERAGGREVSFVAAVGPDGVIHDARTVARGTVDCVLALPGVARRGEMVLHNHPSGRLDPSQADLTVAARLHDGGVGFGIINNDASELYVVVEIPRARPRAAIDPVSAAEALGREGPIAAVLGQFEDRPSQRDMAAFVADTYNEGGISLLEAGTGVGKSFAYLVPAVEWARANRERTVVSTNTINLQEQLVGKDLPVLARALADDELGEPIFALLKGWRNYLCRSRLDLARGGQGSLLESDRLGELDALAGWAAKTRDGSLADLPDDPSPEVWDEVCAEPDLCSRLKCQHFDDCFLFNARRRAAEADILVVNHHLLASDLAVRRAQENWEEAAVLPPYQRLILDEGHHLEDTAAHHLGANVTSWSVHRLLARLERNGKGLIPTLLRELVQQDDMLSAASVELLRQALLPAVGEARERADRLFGLVADRLVREPSGVLRLTEAFASDPVWEQGLGVTLDGFVGVLRRLQDGVETVAERMELQEEQDRSSQLLQELRGVIRRLGAVSDGVLTTLRPSPASPVPEGGGGPGRGSEFVRWIEKRGSKPVGALPFPVGLSSVPLDLAGILRETLFERVETIVMTSATLAAGGDFRYLRGRLGLDAGDAVKYQEILPSPFDFADQCLFGVPTDLPDPRSSETGHDQAVVRIILELAALSDGGMFVLFTSHAALRRAARALQGQLGGRWPLLVQGEAQRDRLLRRFRESGSAILLGTDSFWEGVDVPGLALRVLVLAKLPFKVPDEPLTAARLERLEAEGRDGFRDYLLPTAALKLKQGFGRLIRTRTDFGVVLLLDPRIVTKSYGKVLLESLPPASRVVGPWAGVRDAAEGFFARHGLEAGV